MFVRSFSRQCLQHSQALVKHKISAWCDSTSCFRVDAQAKYQELRLLLTENTYNVIVVTVDLYQAGNKRVLSDVSLQ